MRSANLSAPLKGFRPYNALIGLNQASGLAGGPDFLFFMCPDLTAAEGRKFGTDTQMFRIAGSVIVYGMIYGVVYSVLLNCLDMHPKS